MIVINWGGGRREGEREREKEALRRVADETTRS
jgi:hypothetical protein